LKGFDGVISEAKLNIYMCGLEGVPFGQGADGAYFMNSSVSIFIRFGLGSLFMRAQFV